MASENINLFDADQKPQQSYIVGTVSATFFESPDSFYKVLLVKVSQTNLDWRGDEIVVTGNFADVAEEMPYRFFGKLVEHPKYGQQFQADNYQNEAPTTKEGIVQYLSGDDFPGLGKKTAEKIVALLGLTAIDQINQDPSVLDPLNLKTEVKQTLIDNLTSNNGVEQIIIGLNGYGFGSRLASVIFERYKEKTLQVIQENPYQLVEDINGVSFKRADQIADQLGIGTQSPQRIQAGLLQTLSELAMADGNTFTTAEPLLNGTVRLLQDSRNEAVDPQLIADQLIELGKAQKVVGEGNRIFLKGLYDAEWQAAEHLNRICQAEDLPSFKDKVIEKQMRLVERNLGITYDESQESAILAAIQSHVFLLTGGPGTGKTTIINGIVNLYAKLHELSLDVNQYKDQPFPILLAAPTGRAAKRMSETTGLPASTIHRLLGLTGRENNDDVTAKDLEGSLLIVDEMSMVDIYLFRTLLRAIPDSMQVVLVGDKDQLPSVGPGQVFFDLLSSHRLKEMELNTIYRQDDDSSIIPLAHDIKIGKLPADFTQNKSDRSFIACNAYQMPSVIEQIVGKAKQRGFSADDFQVLAPMYRGPAGVTRLNTLIQDIMNPLSDTRKKEVEFRGEKFRIGDKVLHLVNSPENNVFNGDIGSIVGITLAKSKGNTDKVDKLTVAFDTTEVTYPRNEWDKLTLAYCTTIHKAQGSQFKMVILPMVMQYSRMLQRNLLYTAITRAKSTLILLGEQAAFETSVKRQSVNRQTALVDRITATISDVQESISQQAAEKPAASKPVDQPEGASQPQSEAQPEPVAEDNGPTILNDGILTMSLVSSGQIDPMIGMGKITPKSFTKN
ncbi:ATP-dependent RecD-like DNA helicase [Secundilactobacillus hailunensis]|uniref:ATP-dependent RecD2 DNA helicase n=1 Tax=Secundilactobacillus hailunensis TaxID=2559923 RepID=A0ABW1TCL3_9LACO|nr:ATP-dependent RecD-like DNA helicase [Secundilactobacillus hailunensis]